MAGLPDIYGASSAQTPNYARFGVEFVRGEGSRLYDGDGNEFLDLLCGIGVNSVGHCHTAVVEAVRMQTGTLMHASNLFWTRPAEDLARRLTELSFGDRVFFCNSGAEANEAAIKLARAHATAAGRPGRNVVVLEHAFHGRTMGALSATPQEAKQAPFAPLVHGFRTAPRDDAAALAAMIDDQTCAVLLEPVQGETGVHAIPDDVLLAARDGCDAVGALLIFDEVQCGLGRTGSLFAYEQTPVTPDVMTLAKALGGGLPIGAMVAAEHCSAALQPGFHGSTFGGNPVACAAACAALGIITDDATTANAARVSALLRELLAPLGRCDGRGMMIGLRPPGEFDAPGAVERLLFDHRVIANATGPHTLRLLPPLLLTEDDAREAAAAISEVVTSS
ncbi:MAG: acetylornithine/succinylornithine family transaminase [Actinobacteria bacterium]|nr:acetylornithine/succinylornithine family transaminase [Actinomycetota bacterium]